jgi:hypothetical protein
MLIAFYTMCIVTFQNSVIPLLSHVSQYDLAV